MDNRRRDEELRSSFPVQPPKGAYPTIDYGDTSRLQQRPRTHNLVPSGMAFNQPPGQDPSAYPIGAPHFQENRFDSGEKLGYGGPGAPAVYGQLPRMMQYGNAQLPVHGASKRQQGSGMWEPPAPKSSIPQRANKKALIIGCNYKGTSHELQGCIHDCAHINYMLKTEFGFLDDNICMLTDDGAKFAMPTRANIFSSIDWLVSNLQAGDSLFFHFSGHGSQEPDYTGDERDGLNETLLPSDFKRSGHIIDDEINERLINRLPRGVYLHAVIDACHSGTAMDLEFYTKIRHNGGIEWRCEGPTKKYKGTSGGIAILFSACADHQVAQDTDSLSGSVYTGAATNSFIEAIVSVGPQLTYAQILQHMHTSMAKLAGKSVQPVHGLGGKIMGTIATGIMSVMRISTQTPQISCNIELNLNDRLHI